MEQKKWWIKGWRHRIEGPAVIQSDGTKSWWQDCRRHREDGPAIEWADGTKEWWVEGKKLSEEELIKSNTK